MKIALCFILVAAMLIATAACGGGENQSPDNNQAGAPANTPASTPANTPEGGSGTPVSNVGSGLPWDPDNIGEHTFIMAHGLPATGMTGLQYNEFAVAVEELSGGRMVVDQRIGGTLLTDTETLDGVMMGTVDFVHNLTAFVTGTINDVSPLSMPGYYAGDDWFGFLESSRDIITDIYAEYGVKFLGSVAQGKSAIVCTERQIRTPGDAVGLSFRASGTWISRNVEAWGAAPTMLSLADLPDALQRGVVQGVATGLQITVPFQLYQIARYVTFTDMNETFGSLLMSGSRWESLNADEQALLTEAARIFERNSFDIAQEFINTYIDEIETAGLNEIHHLTPEEQRAFSEITFRMFDEMTPELGPNGLRLIELLRNYIR